MASQDPYGAQSTPTPPLGGGYDPIGGLLSGRTQPVPVTYECGDCGAACQIRPGDVIQCRECGYRILYKTRTTQVVQFDAR
ncbi:hypothetical protein RI054_13g66450 [Pseudoscourfieldia marina]|eukprot:CAMPEP_0119192412 /NCGR_PEP_ID=MMETSP1316-20130426/2923_1 /TAXON_ID=41880 /ORGANISM="Pycnococcus provasolii, Strain RCC2336" /LENGTH=80 /DNA_ID=CAMNT_0007187581 /DNA_START=54 /DNA_END=296 /DNA_ORIENTATION=-